MKTLTRSTSVTKPQEAKTITLDATDKSLGRLATQIATYLRGKNLVSFSPHRLPPIKVIVTNASKITVNERTLMQKEYRTYSGYPGGAHFQSLADLMKKDPAKVIRVAVARMLPRNRLRAIQLRHLIIKR